MNKVAIFPGQLPHVGGGRILIDTIVSNLCNQTQSQIDLYLCEKPQNQQQNLSGKVKYLCQRETAKHIIFKQRNNLWKEALLNEKIDFVLNLSPFEFLDENTPFIQFIWDLNHRTNPWYPEFNHDGDWEFREKQLQRILPRASRIVVGTETGKNQIVKFYAVDEKNVKVIPMTFFAREDRIEQCELKLPQNYIFYPAQFWPHKNHLNLLRALYLINKKNGEPLDLVLCGTDQSNLFAARKLSEDLGLADKVHFYGYVSDGDIIRIYQKAAALVYPSLFGPDNMPPLEAFYFGCPVASASISGVKDQLEDAAVYFDPFDPVDIAEKVVELISNPVLKNTLVAKGRKIAESRMPTNYVNKIYDTIKELITEKMCWKP